MTEIFDRFVHPNLLWHSSPGENREKILKEGLRPRGSVRGYQRKRPVWFYNSPRHYCAASETNHDEGIHGFLCCLEWERAEQGIEFSFESPYVVTVYHQIPPTEILGDFPCRKAANPESLAEVVIEILGIEWAEEVADRCGDPARSWEQQTSLAWTLLSLKPEVYESAQLSHRLISESLQGSVDVSALVEMYSRCPPGFRASFEDNYYAVYEIPHFGRALFVTGARSELFSTLAALLEGDRPASDDPRDEFIAAAFRGLSVEDIGLAVLETLCARRANLPEGTRETTLRWLEDHCEESEKGAIYMVRFADSNFLAREGERGIGAATRILKATGRDYVEMLLELTEADYPPTHFGVCDVLGALQDERAIPYLLDSLSHQDKTRRASAVAALDRIGTPKAVELIRSMQSDRAVQVKKAVESALARH